MEVADIIKLLIQGGVAGVLAVGIIVVWKTWRAERDEHRQIIDDLADKLQTASEKRHEDSSVAIRDYERSTAETNQSLNNMIQQVQQLITLLQINRGGGGTP